VGAAREKVEPRFKILAIDKALAIDGREARSCWARNAKRGCAQSETRPLEEGPSHQGQDAEDCGCRQRDCHCHTAAGRHAIKWQKSFSSLACIGEKTRSSTGRDFRGVHPSGSLYYSETRQPNLTRLEFHQARVSCTKNSTPAFRTPASPPDRPGCHQLMI